MQERTHHAQNTVLLFVASMLCLCVAGCSSTEHDARSGVSAASNDMFLTIEWYGAETKPVKEVAFANSNQEARLKDWVEYKAETGARKGAIISDAECSRLDAILQRSPFKERQLLVQPVVFEESVELKEMQYVMFAHSFRGDVYIPFGVDREKQTMLETMRKSLNSTNQVLLDPIRSFGNRIKMN